MKATTLVTNLVLALIAVLHVLRLVLQVQVTVGGASVPMWASVLAAVFFGALAIGLWRDHMLRPPAAV